MLAEDRKDCVVFLARQDMQTREKLRQTIESEGEQEYMKILEEQEQKIHGTLKKQDSVEVASEGSTLGFRIPLAAFALLALMAIGGGIRQVDQQKVALMKSASTSAEPLILNRRREPYQKFSVLEAVLPSGSFTPDRFAGAVQSEVALGAKKIMIRILDAPGGRITHEMVLTQESMSTMRGWQGPVHVGGLNGFWKTGGPGL